MDTVTKIKQTASDAIAAEIARLTALKTQQQIDGAVKVTSAKVDMKNINKALKEIVNVELRAQLTDVCQGRLDQAVIEGESLKSQSDGEIDALNQALSMIATLTAANFGAVLDTDVVAPSIAYAVLSDTVSRKQTNVLDNMSARISALRNAFPRVQALVESLRFSP